MKIRSINWALWAGFLLSIVAFISYPAFFVKFEETRDFPWANLAFFAVAAVLVFIGLKRAFANGRPLRSKMAGGLLTTLSLIVLAFFIFNIFIAARWLPASQAAPHVGQKAPDFTLSDTNGESVSLSQLLSEPVNGKTPKGVLLVFYRGYW
jgi:AhpC/TSA family